MPQNVISRPPGGPGHNSGRVPRTHAPAASLTTAALRCRRLPCAALLTAVVLALSACAPSPEAGVDTGRSPATPPAHGAQAVASSAAVAPGGVAAAPVFNVATLPVSNVPLDSFPYLVLPPGYGSVEVVQNDFDRVPFWTGDRIVWTEGRVYSTALRSENDQQYSPHSLSAEVAKQVSSFGGERIFSGLWPAAASAEVGNSKAAVTYVGGLGDIYNEPAATYVIHRTDRDIWVHLGAGGMLVAETVAGAASNTP